MTRATSEVSPGLFRRDKAADLLPPVLASFLSGVVIVIRPIERYLTSKYAFLTLTLQILFFYPIGSLASQIESNLICFAGGLLSLGYCNLFLYFANLANNAYPGNAVGRVGDAPIVKYPAQFETAGARAACGVGLAVLAFICGLIRSISPRLIGFTRIMGFFGVWLLTDASDIIAVSRFTFTELFFPMLFASVFSLVATAIGHFVIPPRQRHLRDSVDQVFEHVCDMLDAQVEVVTHGSDAKNSFKTASDIFDDVKAQYGHAVHSISVAPTSPRASNILVRLLSDDLRRSVVVNGGGPLFAADARSMVTQNSELYQELPKFAQNLRRYLKSSQPALDHAWGHPRPYPRYSLPGLKSEANATGRHTPQEGLKSLENARESLKEDLATLQSLLVKWLENDLTVIDRSLFEGGHRRSRLERRGQVKLQMAHWLIGLLDLGRLLAVVLDEAHRLASDADRPPRVWLPRFEFRVWLHKAQPQMRAEEPNRLVLERYEPPQDATDNRVHADLARALTRDTQMARESPKEKVKTGSLWARVAAALERWWEVDLLESRIRLSRIVHSFKHSHHLRYALKVAAGTTLLALPGLLPVGSAGRVWFQDSNAEWAVISYLFVLDVSTGATFQVGFWRLCGTIGGSVMAYIGYLIAHGNPFGLVAVATVYSLPIAYVIFYTRVPGIASVAGITIPPILFIPYIEDETRRSSAILALWRAEQVAVGIVAAWLINTLFWPYHARVAYLNVTAKLLDHMSTMYIEMSKTNLRQSLAYDANPGKFAALDSTVERYLTEARDLIAIQRAEFSLLPKPVQLYASLTDTIAAISDKLVEIRTLRFSIPRKETVLDVLDKRRDIVNAIYLNMFAVAHTIRSHQPVPQYLPRPDEAVRRFADGIDHHLRSRRSDDGSASPAEQQRELAVAYFQAELAAMLQLCGHLDDLVELAKRLFGTKQYMIIE